MNRSLTALFAAFEAALVIGVGIGIPLVPLTVLWAAQYGFASDWFAFWRAAVDTWLLGHGADLHVALDETLATGLGLSGDQAAFSVTIAPLGFALLTLLLATRAGRRVAETRHRQWGTLVSLATFAGLTTLLALSSVDPAARPSLTQGILLPSLVFAIGFLIGMVRTRRAVGDDDGSSLRDWYDDWHPLTRAIVATGARAGTAVVAGVVAVSAVLVAVLLAVNYAAVVSLYEGLHAEALGGFSLTLAEIAFMPNLVIWAASWLIGPGFAIGTGSSVSPLATQLGPVPAIPVLGALPTGELAFGFLGLLVPVVVGFLVAAVSWPRLAAVIEPDRPVRWIAASALAVGVTAGVLLGLLAWFSGGAAGPGRLVDVGPDALAVAGWATLEVTGAALLGFLAASRRPR